VRQSLPDEPGEPRTALYPSLRTFREHRDAATREYVVDLLACVGDDIERACAVSGLSRSRLYALIKAAGLRHGEADRPT
jgi:two-component system NtrC family response regulator